MKLDQIMQVLNSIVNTGKEVTMKAKLLLLIALLFTCYAFSQEIEVRKADRIEFRGLHIKTSDNQTFVLWKDYVNSRNDISVQKLNHLGVEQWQSPIRLGVDGADNFPVAAVRSSDGANVLLWSTVDYPQRKLYLAKFDDNGVNLWPSAPLLVFSNNDTLPWIHMIANASGGVFIVYTADFTSTGIMGINIDGSGNNLWEPGNYLLYDFASTIQVRSIHPDGEGGMIVNCYVEANGSTYKSHLIRFAPTGDIVGSNPLVPEGSFSMMIKNCLSTNDGNLLLYSASLYSNPTLYMQKIDNLGNPVGSLYSHPFQDYLSCRNLQLKPSLNGGVIAAWRESANNTLTTKCLSWNSSLQSLWTPEGVTINQPDYDFYDLALEPDAYGGAWLYSYGQIYCVNPLGEAIFSPDGISFSAKYVPSALLVAGPDNLSVFWQEEHNRSLSLRKQMINSDGEVLLGAEGTPIVSRLAGFAMGSRTYVLADKYLCLWSDGRIGGKASKLFYQIFDDNGSPLLEVNGRELNPGNDHHESLIEARVLQGDKLAIVYQSSSINYEYSLQVIDANGDRLIDGPGLVLGVPGPFSSLMMDCYEQDIYLGWIEESNIYRLKGQRITNLQKQWGEEGVTLIEFPQNSFAYLSSLCGRYYVFSLEDYNINSALSRAALIEPSGIVSPGWNPLGNPLLDASVYGYQYSSHTELLENDLVTIIRTSQGINSVAVAQRMNPDGLCLWTDEGVVIPESTRDESVSLYVLNDHINLLYTVGYGPHLLRYQRIDAEGNLLWENGGMDIGTSTGFGLSYQLTGFNDGVQVAIYETDGPEETYWGNYYDLGLKYISPEGVPAWENPVLCAAPYDQRYVSVASSGDQALICWTDDRAGVYSEDYAYSSIYGRIITSEPLSTQDPVLPYPAVAVLHQNYPNPFNPSTTISFSLESASEVSLQIYNLKGQLVKTLCSKQSFLPGRHELSWNGLDENQRSISSGLYLYRLSSRGSTQVKKMLLTK